MFTINYPVTRNTRLYTACFMDGGQYIYIYVHSQTIWNMRDYLEFNIHASISNLHSSEKHKTRIHTHYSHVSHHFGLVAQRRPRQSNLIWMRKSVTSTVSQWIWIRRRRPIIYWISSVGGQEESDAHSLTYSGGRPSSSQRPINWSSELVPSAPHRPSSQKKPNA